MGITLTTKGKRQKAKDKRRKEKGERRKEKVEVYRRPRAKRGGKSEPPWFPSLEGPDSYREGVGKSK
jgi:hypothetical protein